MSISFIFFAAFVAIIVLLVVWIVRTLRITPPFNLVIIGAACLIGLWAVARRGGLF